MAQGSWEAEGEEKKEEEEGAQRRLELTGAGFTIKHGDSMGFSQEIGIYNQLLWGYNDCSLLNPSWLLIWIQKLAKKLFKWWPQRPLISVGLGVLGLYWYFNSLPWNITVFQWIIPRWQFSHHWAHPHFPRALREGQSCGGGGWVAGSKMAIFNGCLAFVWSKN